MLHTVMKVLSDAAVRFQKDGSNYVFEAKGLVAIVGVVVLAVTVLFFGNDLIDLVRKW